MKSKNTLALIEGLKMLKGNSSNSYISPIELYRQHIELTKAKELAEALVDNKSLTAIDLSNNNIGAEGAKALAEALVDNKSLTKIDLFGNDIGADALKKIDTQIEENKQISQLIKESDPLKDLGGQSERLVGAVLDFITENELPDEDQSYWFCLYTTKYRKDKLDSYLQKLNAEETKKIIDAALELSSENKSAVCVLINQMDLKELDELCLKKIISFIGADANFQECNDLFDTATQLLNKKIADSAQHIDNKEHYNLNQQENAQELELAGNLAEQEVDIL
jgi:hypothetical protein